MYKEDISGRTAFISGASAGIGEATAKALASNGVNLILTARRIDKLENLKNSLEKEYKIKVKVIKIDFSKSEDIVNALNSLEDEWKNIEETLYLSSISGLVEEINTIKKNENWNKAKEFNPAEEW